MPGFISLALLPPQASQVHYRPQFQRLRLLLLGNLEARAGRYKEALAKANIGKSCVRFKRLSDLDTAALKKLIRESAAFKA